MPALLHPDESPYIFVTCQVGAEPTLKKEIAREHTELRFAFSRPGFLTFKGSQKINASFELRSIFARAYGFSCGKLTGAERVSGVLEFAKTLSAGGPVALHLWERDRHPVGEEPKGFVDGAWERAALAELRGAPGFSERLKPTQDPKAGEWVMDVVVVEEDEWWVGAHRHSALHSRFPGALIEVAFPPEAPSRAYLKLEQGLIWSQAPVRSGDQAVEIGSAPGGASYALLKRGISVAGIDPGEMDPRVLKFSQGQARFKHFQKPVAQVLREELPEKVDWLLLDMNVEPRISLYAVDRLATRLKETLLGVFLTIKLNQWKIADELPDMLAHIKAMGMVRVRATQLAGNKQEIFVYGLSRKGVSRVSQS